MERNRRRRRGEPTLEWRCYQLSGTPGMLDDLEETLRRLVKVGGENETQIVCAIFQGVGGRPPRLQELGSWETLPEENEEEEAEDENEEEAPEESRGKPEFCSVIYIER